jgi:hypothetical protein
MVRSHGRRSGLSEVDRFKADEVTTEEVQHGRTFAIYRDSSTGESVTKEFDTSTSTSGLQGAIDHIDSNATEGRGSVHMVGKHSPSAKTVIQNNFKAVYCYGHGATRIDCSADTWIQVGDANNKPIETTIGGEGVYVDGPGSDGGDGAAIHIRAARNVDLHDIYAKNFKYGFWQENSAGLQCIDTELKQCVWEAHKSKGVFIDGSQSSEVIQRIEFIGGYAFNNQGKGMHIVGATGPSSSRPTNIRITGYEIGDSDTHGLHIEGAEARCVDWRGGRITNSGAAGGGESNILIDPDGSGNGGQQNKFVNVDIIGADVTLNTQYNRFANGTAPNNTFNFADINTRRTTDIMSFRGWKNFDKFSTTASDDDAVSYSMDDDGYTARVNADGDNTYFAKRSSPPQGGAFKVRVYDISDGSQVTADTAIEGHVFGYTYPTGE